MPAMTTTILNVVAPVGYAIIDDDSAEIVF